MVMLGVLPAIPFGSFVFAEGSVGHVSRIFKGKSMLTTINPQAAAGDVGSETIHVSIAGGPVQVFSTFTRHLLELRDYLLENKVTAFAMEFTGVYWMPLYEILEKTSIELCLINGAHVKNLPGRKTDVADCQWLAQLHAHGLLKA